MQLNASTCQYFFPFILHSTKFGNKLAKQAFLHLRIVRYVKYSFFFPSRGTALQRILTSSWNCSIWKLLDNILLIISFIWQHYLVHSSSNNRGGVGWGAGLSKSGGPTENQNINKRGGGVKREGAVMANYGDCFL